MLTAISSTIKAETNERRMPTFHEAVEMHKAMVYSIGWHYLHDRHAAEEMAQEVFLQLHTSWAGIQSREHLLFWLRRTATHRAIDAGRKRRTKAEITLEEADEPTMLERVHDTLLSSYLNRMVGTLPDKQRSAIILGFYDVMLVVYF